MKQRRPLFAKIFFWALLNVAVVAAIPLGYFNMQFRLGSRSPFGGPGPNRATAVAFAAARDLGRASPGVWQEILDRYSATYNVDFILANEEGRVVAGVADALPEKIRAGIVALAAKRDGPPGHFGPPPFPGLSLRTTHPTRYWFGVRQPVGTPDGEPPAEMVVLLRSDSATGHGLFFDPTPWIAIPCLIVVVSMLLWIPMVRHITRPISAMKKATEQIARGKFDVRLPDRRGDEIGELSRAINEMAARLEGYVKGQKRFLGDVAHELASPVARIQLGLGILEQKIDGSQLERVKDIDDDARGMAALVHELLSFSRAEMSGAEAQRAAPLQEIALAPIVRRVLDRENLAGAQLRVDAADDLIAVADSELLTRALANVVRNAVQYAGAAGPIDVVAVRRGDEIVLEVRDSGRGVPAEALPHLFEPFYRVDASRGRETGGVGLGLAIVKTCVEACGGSVAARNLAPSGFCVSLTLRVGSS
jgi:two-component system sensor histidine kinase CpxA